MKEKKIEVKRLREDYIIDLLQALMNEIKVRREENIPLLGGMYGFPEPEFRSLKEDFLTSPEKFEELLTFYDLLLTKLKEESSGFEIITKGSPKVLKWKSSPDISYYFDPSNNEEIRIKIDENLKKIRDKVGNIKIIKGNEYEELREEIKELKKELQELKNKIKK